jgi:hypothetical protein
VLLVVVNFDDAPAFMDVRIPAHAFDYLTIKEKSVTAKELLTGENQELNLKRDGTIAIKLETLGAKVLKFIV